MSAIPLRRKSSLAAEKRLRSQLENVEDNKEKQEKFHVKFKKQKSNEESDFEDKGSSDQEEEPEVELKSSPESKKTKKRKVSNGISKGHNLLQEIIRNSSSGNSEATSDPPLRHHRTIYHRPLLLDDPKHRSDLLIWFDSVSTARSMPWRKEWINPSTSSDPNTLRSALERRAYEVWISEIMLQQTRVAVVIDYWNKWMNRWPTIQDLANASADDVLSAWRGLGYYSRASRIHEAAKKVVADSQMQGLLPSTAEELQAKVPGVGRYTGGAISAIVFGHPEPMVDGNVLRVMARQTGLFTNVKSNKIAIDALWSAADALVKEVAKDHANSNGSSSETISVSDGPGRWGQALMELGSTICTPKPDCANCPITKTCRAYAEGISLAQKANLISISSQLKQPVTDIEDLCTVCEPFEEDAGAISADIVKEEESSSNLIPAHKPKSRQSSLAAFAFTSKPRKSANPETSQPNENTKPNAKAMEMIVNHCKKFPVKVIKKAVREEETIVCAIRNKDGKYLINKRPEKGLLAGMWEFPSDTLPNTNDSTSKDRKKRAMEFMKKALNDESLSKKSVAHGELGSVPWLFSHLKLTMHVYLFEIDQSTSNLDGVGNKRWASQDEVEDESMGTGMRKCWSLVKERI